MIDKIVINRFHYHDKLNGIVKEKWNKTSNLFITGENKPFPRVKNAT